MLSVLNLMYSVPVLLALVITGAAVSGRIGQGARGLMWSGSGLLALTQFSSAATAALVQTRMPSWSYGMVHIITVVLTTIGTVLLILAVARAAREGQPFGPSAPGMPNYPPARPGSQAQGSSQPHSGDHPYGGTQPDSGNYPYGGTQPFDQPGTGDDQQRPR